MGLIVLVSDFRISFQLFTPDNAITEVTEEAINIHPSTTLPPDDTAVGGGKWCIRLILKTVLTMKYLAETLINSDQTLPRKQSDQGIHCMSLVHFILFCRPFYFNLRYFGFGINYTVCYYLT